MLASSFRSRLLLVLACAVCVARSAAAQLPPFEVVYEFGDEAANPGPLIEASDGNFYGTTTYGGIYNRGTIFRMTRDYRVAILYEFSGAFDGGYPAGKLLEASDGHLYGATAVNGAYNQGILFRFTLDGEFKILHHFNNALDTRSPNGSLVQGADGSLYGTTVRGGPFDLGTVFRATLDGDVTVLRVFAGGPADTSLPGPLLRSTDGSFFGRTRGDNLIDFGTVFRMTAAGVVTILHRFAPVTTPFGSNVAWSTTLIQGADGNVYGNYGCFTGIFRITPQGAFSAPSSLPVPVDCGLYGAAVVELLAGADGLLYASHVPEGAVLAVHLSGVANFIQRYGPLYSEPARLIQSRNGHLYGTIPYGRSYRGQIFRITPRPGQAATAGAMSTGGAAVRLTWSPVANALSYVIRRRASDGSSAVIVSGTQGSSFVDSTTVRGSRYTYIVTGVNAFGEGVASQEISIVAGRAAAGDFDGDGAADAAIFRPATGEWHIRGAPEVVTWGGAGDVPVAADYDGDGIVDIAVFRPSTGTWHIRGIGSIEWGGSGDIPVAGYYRGGVAVDLAVFRPSTGTWYIRGLGAIAWGTSEDTPTPDDYDGDGRTDVSVFRGLRKDSNGWFIRYATGASAFKHAYGADHAVPGDYDGDGRSDLVTSPQPSPFDEVWTVEWSTIGEFNRQLTVVRWGGVADTPVSADYNGDGLADIAVFRESTGMWYVLFSGPRTSPQTAMQFRWGGPGDIPIQKAP